MKLVFPIACCLIVLAACREQDTLAPEGSKAELLVERSEAS